VQGPGGKKDDDDDDDDKWDDEGRGQSFGKLIKTSSGNDVNILFKNGQKYEIF
jgi:hypothetical protein